MLTGIYFFFFRQEYPEEEKYRLLFIAESKKGIGDRELGSWN